MGEIHVMRQVQRFTGTLLIAFAIAGCQTTGLGTPAQTQSSGDTSVSKQSYTLFFDQKDHLQELMDSGNLSDASILYEEQRTFFDKEKATDEELSGILSQLVLELKSPHQKKITSSLSEIEAISWPTKSSKWQNIRQRIDTTNDVIKGVPDTGIFANASYRPENLNTLEDKLSKLKSDVAATATADFDSFDHFADTDFFSVHPGARDAKAFFQKNPAQLTALLDGRNPAQVNVFAQKMGKNRLSKQQWQTIGHTYAEAKMRDLPKKEKTLKAILSIIEDVREAGFNIDQLDTININFVEVTSKTLLKQGQIDFPAQVEVDLPFDISKADIESAFSSKSAFESDYLIVFDVALAKARRKVKRMRDHRSEVIVGYHQEANPEYRQLQNQVNMTQMAAQNAAMNLTMQQNQHCSGFGCIAVAIAINNARKKRDVAQSEFQSVMQRLNSTKSMVEVPLKQPYSYQVGEIDAEKTMTVHYYVIDKAKKRYFKSTFDIVENERFGVAYRVASEDPNREANIAKHDTEQEVSDWEKAPSSIKLSQLINHYVSNQTRSKPLKSLNTLRSEMLKDRNTAIASYKENTFEESTANDPRFDSVVVIYNPGGGLGTGFFVQPDIVMTNYHVVGEGEFVELKMHDEQETFGKVIARDAGLDLALVRVQSRGKPVKFYQKNKIELGKTVEVIGHPKAYEFSITRGVVSAIRKEKSIVLNAGPDILHIQVDASITNGNSGGPVFMGDRVISVVSWGRVDRGAGNLNFTVHHSEAQRFLSEALPGS